MLTTYLICMLSGGALVSISIFLGGDTDSDVDTDADFEASLDVDHDLDFEHDLDLDSDVDLDVDVDVDADADLGGHDIIIHGDSTVGEVAAEIWLPFLSLRFWIFATAFFGLTGTLLSYFSELKDDLTIGLISGGMGFFAGLAMTYFLRSLQKGQIPGTIPAKEYVGRTAQVLVAIDDVHPGKIRLHIHETDIDMIAKTTEGVELKRGDTAFVVSVNLHEGTALVVKNFQRYRKKANHESLDKGEND